MLKIDQIVFSADDKFFKCIFWAETNGDFLTLIKVAESLLAYSISEFDFDASDFDKRRDQIVDDVICQGISDIPRINHQSFLEYSEDSSLFCVSPTHYFDILVANFFYHIRPNHHLTMIDAKIFLDFFQTVPFKEFSDLMRQFDSVDSWKASSYQREVFDMFYKSLKNNFSEYPISLVIEEVISDLKSKIEEINKNKEK